MEHNLPSKKLGGLADHVRSQDRCRSTHGIRFPFRHARLRRGFGLEDTQPRTQVYTPAMPPPSLLETIICLLNPLSTHHHATSLCRDDGVVLSHSPCMSQGNNTTPLSSSMGGERVKTSENVFRTSSESPLYILLSSIFIYYLLLSLGGVRYFAFP